jgi:hypothetical protein
MEDDRALSIADVKKWTGPAAGLNNGTAKLPRALLTPGDARWCE